jgi:hypothetical protein
VGGCGCGCGRAGGRACVRACVLARASVTTCLSVSVSVCRTPHLPSLPSVPHDAHTHTHTHTHACTQIWLFGLSRGAYTVRCVAGMIYNCGVLDKSKFWDINHQPPVFRGEDYSLALQEVYRIYRDPSEHCRPSSKYSRCVVGGCAGCVGG